ncbi:ribonuclease inhibitor-like, partial [Morone saxatilis]|uniref:ribonuclease inhibitor-like n=1 Tax=Morone saxatilis TaxID=34816 RepID=UPI0015E1D785
MALNLSFTYTVYCIKYLNIIEIIYYYYFHKYCFRLSGCKLSKKGCEALFSVLNSKSSCLRELDLSNNNLQDEGVKLLCVGLESPHCRLEILRLRVCNLSWRSCEALCSVLSSKSSCLRELDLSNNDLSDEGVRWLTSALKSSNCALKTLRLSGCLITQKGCAALASALNSKPPHLKELELSYNHPGDSGVKLSGLKDSGRLETLSLEPHGVCWLKPGLRKYASEVSLDLNTANRFVRLSDSNRKATMEIEKQSYPNHQERFDHCKQVLAKQGVTGRCYWE